MAKDRVKLKFVNENQNTLEQSFGDEVEMICSKPSQMDTENNNHITNNVHLMDAELGLETHSNTNNGSLGESDMERPTQPLLEPSRERNIPPLADVNGLATQFDDSRPVSPTHAVIPEVNTYQHLKNLSQGMMDLALLSANANQLRYVVESASIHPYYYSSLVFISLSIIIQMLVGVGLIVNSRYDVNVETERRTAEKINNMTVFGVFLITVVNVFITSFSVATQTVAAVPQ